MKHAKEKGAEQNAEKNRTVKKKSQKEAFNTDEGAILSAKKDRTTKKGI